MTTSKGGPPTKRTPEVVSILVTNFQNGQTVSKACDSANISRDTYYEWIKEDKGLSDIMEKARNWTLDKARQVVTNAISKGDTTTSKWYLERKARKEFATRVESTGADGKPLEVMNYDMSKLDNKQIEALLGMQKELDKEKKK